MPDADEAARGRAEGSEGSQEPQGPMKHSVASIMRRLHHSIAIEIEGSREGLTSDDASVSVDRSLSVSASDEDEANAFYGVQQEIPFPEGDPHGT